MKTLIAITIMICVAIFGLGIWCFYNDETVNKPQAYQTWLKMGGNTNITYREWRQYIEATTTITPQQLIIINHY